MTMNNSELYRFYQYINKKEYTKSVKTVRDLTKIDLTNEFSLIIAVDSDGGIGQLEGDAIKCDPYQLGRFAMRVPLLELLACGAKPVAAFDMLTIPMEGTGKEIVRGIRDELKQAEADNDFPLSGSTEDNVPTIMTGVGTTIIGIVRDSDFRPGTSRKNDVILCVGLPKSAPEDTVYLDDPDIVNQADILKLLEIDGVHEILPVGSKGIGYEANELAKTASLNFIPDQSCRVNLNKSGGPSSCVITSCFYKSISEIKQIISVPINLIGQFK